MPRSPASSWMQWAMTERSRSTERSGGSMVFRHAARRLWQTISAIGSSSNSTARSCPSKAAAHGAASVSPPRGAATCLRRGWHPALSTANMPSPIWPRSRAGALTPCARSPQRSGTASSDASRPRRPTSTESACSTRRSTARRFSRARTTTLMRERRRRCTGAPRPAASSRDRSMSGRDSGIRSARFSRFSTSPIPR